MKGRPVLYVLAGVNGAGKSSIGGRLLLQAGLDWFNPDTFARELVAATGCDQGKANAAAWNEGMRRLDDALATGSHFAFETTLGGRTVPARIMVATRTHDVLMWFCGLPSPEQHIARVGARVAAGGHAIDAVKIRERYPAALRNLVDLLPHLSSLQVYDNSIDASPGTAIPDPMLVAEVVDGKRTFPNTRASIVATPEWAKPIVEAVLSLG